MPKQTYKSGDCCVPSLLLFKSFVDVKHPYDLHTHEYLLNDDLYKY